MSKGDVGSVFDTLEFDTNRGEQPRIIHIGGEVFAVVWRGESGGDRTGEVATFTIGADGTIGSAVIDTFRYDTKSFDAMILHIVGNVYAVVYQGADNDGFLITFTIDADGTIATAVIDTLEFETVQAAVPLLIHISGQIYAIAYNESNQRGTVVTVDIDSVGQIGAAVIDTLVYESDFPTQDQLIAKVAGDIYVIAYVKASSARFTVVTVDIDSSGVIANSVVDSATPGTLNLNRLKSMVRVGTIGSDAVFAVIYQEQTTADGFIVTFSITAAGTISTSTIDSFRFVTVEGNNPRMIPLSADLYAIVYRDDASGGQLASVQIKASGSIVSAVLGKTQFDTLDSTFPADLIRVPDSNDIVAVVYEQETTDDGFVNTLQITSLLSGYIWIEGEAFHYTDENEVERFVIGARDDHASIESITSWLGL